MPGSTARAISCALALFALGPAGSLLAQLEAGTWVRQPTDSMPGMTMTIATCCNGGRRITYHVAMGDTERLLTIETQLDGRDAAVLLDGQPSGETMSITRVDSHHAPTVVKMNGKPFGTAKATLSPDGRTLTVLDDFSASIGGGPIGKYTEVWVRK